MSWLYATTPVHFPASRPGTQAFSHTPGEHPGGHAALAGEQHLIQISAGRGIATRLLTLIILLAGGPLNAQTPASVQPEAAGRIIAVAGEVFLIDRDRRRQLLPRGGILRQGDRLITGPDSHAQIRFLDGALMSVRPESELRIEHYRFNGRQDGSERSHLSLLRGGFRTITGLIGKRHKNSYRVTTPIADIRVRGTHYGIRLCGAGNCAASTTMNTGSVPPGLYGHVRQGAIAMGNAAGQFSVGRGEGVYLADQSSPARPADVALSLVFDPYPRSQPTESPSKVERAAAADAPQTPTNDEPPGHDPVDPEQTPGKTARPPVSGTPMVPIEPPPADKVVPDSGQPGAAAEPEVDGISPPDSPSQPSRSDEAPL